MDANGDKPSNSVPVGVLNGESIRSMIESENLIENWHGDWTCLQGASIDLRVGDAIRRGERLDSTKPFTLEPGGVVTILTAERVQLPNWIMGTVFPRNSESTRGLLVLNPGHIDPGTRAHLSIVATNMSRAPIPIEPKMKILTLILERLPMEATPYPNISKEDKAAKFADLDASRSAGNLASLIAEAASANSAPLGSNAVVTTTGLDREVHDAVDKAWKEKFKYLGLYTLIMIALTILANWSAVSGLFAGGTNAQSQKAQPPSITRSSDRSGDQLESASMTSDTQNSRGQATPTGQPASESPESGNEKLGNSPLDPRP